MQAIFYDLETSDKDPIGQILNYSFIHVDSDLNPVTELSGNIRISRLQLPRASAILANRIDVLEHQRTSPDDELRGMKRIFDFLLETTRGSRERLAFIGFNSSRFDLLYLRTSLIRNGLNPYAWNSSIVERDLLHSARKLSISHPGFPRRAADGGEESRLSLRLETLAQSLGLLKGKQSHASRDDVLLTIELARTFKTEFGFDALSFSAYQGASFERNQRKANVYAVHEPNYDLKTPGLSVAKPVSVLCADQKYSLWVDLRKHKEGQGRRSVSYVKKFGADFFVTEDHTFGAEWSEQAEKAQAEFRNLNLQNYFSPSVCDIEQFIYRLDFDGRASLGEAIWNAGAESRAGLKAMDAKILYKRHELRTYEWGGAKDREVENDLLAYALRRYGGKVIMSRSEAEPDCAVNDQYYHPTWSQLLAEIEEGTRTGSVDDKKLLGSLHEFYLTSDIFRVAGRELESLASATPHASSP